MATELDSIPPENSESIRRVLFTISLLSWPLRSLVFVLFKEDTTHIILIHSVPAFLPAVSRFLLLENDVWNLNEARCSSELLCLNNTLSSLLLNGAPLKRGGFLLHE